MAFEYFIRAESLQHLPAAVKGKDGSRWSCPHGTALHNPILVGRRYALGTLVGVGQTMPEGKKEVEVRPTL